MLTKQITFDQQITEDGFINVRTITRIFEDGNELSKSYHRHVVTPLDNVENEDDRTKVIASAIYTPEFVKVYKKKMKEQKKEIK